MILAGTLRRFIRSLVVRAARTRRGRRLLMDMLRSDLDVCLEVLGSHYNRAASFATAVPNVHRIEGFEDLVWLFTSTPVGRGVARLDLDEAAYLYRLLRSLPGARGVEIGRFKGGSTLSMAAAMAPDARLLSIDNHTKMDLSETGPVFDEALGHALARFGLEDRVTLAVADSGSVPVSCDSVDFVFFDGDHSYAGVSRDFHHWKDAVGPGGHLLFHDGARARAHTTVHEGVERLVREISGYPQLTPVAEIGSLVHLRRTAVPWDARPAAVGAGDTAR